MHQPQKYFFEIGSDYFFRKECNVPSFQASINQNAPEAKETWPIMYF